MNYRILEFAEHGDDRGKLVIAESGKEIPFDIKRVFYIYGTEKGVVRGQHANKYTQFILINVKGTSKVMIDDGKSKTVIELDKPNKAIFIDKLVWKDMYDFSEDSILLVLCSELYDANEYIRDYEEYLKIKKNI